ncbi:hypothetical protein FIBSPDRAFT_938071 [Athelia psychrophila]|uniref:Uncharacterized protein n=1 Tax=Athelia psychrophila TaxID=1759441 RepID=A0A165Z961_9AGAM|nr:hypothetical protein FIBSPDRAFT_938071 [Fibularhizoctonia sp. CBS 109695]
MWLTWTTPGPERLCRRQDFGCVKRPTQSKHGHALPTSKRLEVICVCVFAELHPADKCPITVTPYVPGFATASLRKRLGAVHHEASIGQRDAEPREMCLREHYPRTRQVRDHSRGLEGGEAPLERAGRDAGEDQSRRDAVPGGALNAGGCHGMITTTPVRTINLFCSAIIDAMQW